MLTTFLAAAALFQPAPEPDAAPDQPPITLTIDGVAHELHDGRTTTITIDGKAREVRIDLPTVSRYADDRVTFEFPASFAGSRDRSDTSTSRRYMDGNCILMVWDFATPVTLETLVGMLAAQYADAMPEDAITDVIFETSAGEISGKLLRVNFANAHIHQELYRVGDDAGATFFLLQDARENPNHPTESFTKLRQSIARSLRRE
jgi:hypothetical protein